MAIKPSEAGHLTDLDKAACDAAEKRIDALLRSRYQPGQPVGIGELGASDRQDRELIRRYESAGWVITRNDGYDQRDGSYWEFKPR